jgi:TolB-like protein/Tfp pilus assembly protein PilF
VGFLENAQQLEHEGEVGASSSLALSDELIRKHLEKILSSESFLGSAAQARFLRYAVEQALGGHEDRLKEYSIGTGVFGRGDSFDPARDNIVRIQAGRLRSRLARYYQSEGTSDPVQIEFPKGGYAPVFRTTPSLLPPHEGAALEGSPPVGAAASPHASFPRKVAALIILGLLTSGAGGYLLRQGRRAYSPAVDAPSIAVLPFLNRSDDKEGEIFSDGLTDELIDSLGRMPRIRVVARSSAFQFKNKVVDIRRVGPELSVRTVLEGSVRKYGNRLRITAELDDTTTGYRLWSESYDRELKDALAIQRDIARSIVDALGVPLAGKTPSDRPQSSREAGSVNAEAYQNYLKGRYFWNKRTQDSIKTAIGYFEQAIAQDPSYADAYAALAQCYAMGILTTTPQREIVLKIRKAASRALELDDTLGQAHLDLARASEFEYDWSAAEKEFQKGLALNPEDEMAHRWYASYLMRVGRPEEALAENQRALNLDPISPYMAQGMAGSLDYSRRYDDAIERYREELVLEPNSGLAHRGLGIAYIHKGMRSQGIAELQVARKLMEEDSSVMGYLGYAYALSGDEDRAREVLRELLARFNTEPSLSPAIARVYIGLADKDEAFRWFQKAINDQAGPVLLLKVDPLLDSLRSDPRFADLLRLMKLNSTG